MITILTVENIIPQTEHQEVPVVNITRDIVINGNEITRSDAAKKKINFEYYIDMHAMEVLSQVEDGLQEFYETITSSMIELTNMGLRRSMVEPGKKVTIYRESQVTSAIFNNHLHFSMNNVDRTVVE